MPDKDIGQITGQVLQSLPIDQMIALPLISMVKAQIQASHAYVEFIKTIGLDSDTAKAVMVDFEVDEDVQDQAGKVVSTRRTQFKVPLLAIVTHPNISIDRATIDFDLTVEASESEHSSTEGGGEAEATLGWGIFSLKAKGRVSHKKEQTRSTDTRAKFSFHVEAGREKQPEGMARVLDYLMDASTRPSNQKDQRSDDSD